MSLSDKKSPQHGLSRRNSTECNDSFAERTWRVFRWLCNVSQHKHTQVHRIKTNLFMLPSFVYSWNVAQHATWEEEWTARFIIIIIITIIILISFCSSSQPSDFVFICFYSCHAPGRVSHMPWRGYADPLPARRWQRAAVSTPTTVPKHRGSGRVLWLLGNRCVTRSTSSPGKW